jgi:hypothetical protein
LDLFVSFGLSSIDGRRGFPSVTKALATAKPAACPVGECDKPPVSEEEEKNPISYRYDERKLSFSMAN